MPLTITHGRHASVVTILAVALLLFPHTAVAQSNAPAPAVQDDPFARRAWQLELTGHSAIETWNYNISHEDMLALVPAVTYGVGRGVVITVQSPLYYVWQRGTDAYLFGINAGVRSRVLRRPRWSLFWEFQVGVSESDTYAPPGGTRFNYLAIGGTGVTLRLRPGVSALAGLRWIHVSNNGLAGRSRNPDIEAVGPMAGVLIGF